jgi:hypothetical protein
MANHILQNARRLALSDLHIHGTMGPGEKSMSQNQEFSRERRVSRKKLLNYSR